MENPFHILVVDDDPIKLRALSRLLQATGYDISEAALGSDCIRLAREKHPDIILLDVKLPDIDGVEVCRRLKADPELMTSLVIHLSAVRTSSDDQVDGLEAGADGYIIQPISNKELLARVKAFVRLKKTEDRLRRREAELKAANEQLTATLNALPDLLLEVGRDGRIYDYRAPSPEKLEVEPQELQGKTILEVFPPELVTVIQQAIDQAVVKGRHYGGVIGLQMSTGYQWYELAIAAKGDIETPSSRFILMARNISERQRAEAEKEKLAAQLAQAQKMEAIGTLAVGIAQEFNNTLWAIMGFTELTLNAIPEGSREHQFLMQIWKAGERARDMVNQILAFSRKSGQKRAVQLALVVEDAIKLLRATITANITINSIIASPETMVLADPAQMHLVLMNLGTNAAQAMREKGGTLEVTLEEKYLDQDSLGKYQDLAPGPFVILTFRDTGHGIAPEILDRIFDPFFTTKEVGEGTGMGLAVVFGIVKAHGGGISVLSKPEAGTTFTILLPIVASQDV